MPSAKQTIQTKEPSKELLSMVQQAAHNFVGFATVWSRVLEKGKQEGFSEKELQDMIRPHLKKKLTKGQIYYAFHRESEMERIRKSKGLKIQPNDGKIVPYDPDWNGEEEEEDMDVGDDLPVTQVVDMTETRLKSVGAFIEDENMEQEISHRRIMDLQPLIDTNQLEESVIWDWLKRRSESAEVGRFYFENHTLTRTFLGYPKGHVLKRLYLES